MNSDSNNYGVMGSIVPIDASWPQGALDLRGSTSGQHASRAAWGGGLFEQPKEGAMMKPPLDNSYVPLSLSRMNSVKKVVLFLMDELIRELQKPILPHELEMGWSKEVVHKWINRIQSIRDQIEKDVPMDLGIANFSYGMAHDGISPYSDLSVQASVISVLIRNSKEFIPSFSKC
jgi:hypothetical protein